MRAAIPLALEQIDVMLRLIAACGRPVRRVLDLGCGDGVLASAIVQRVPGAEVVLADFSEPMLEAARKRFSAAGVVAHFVLADYGVPSWTEAVAEWSPYDAIVSGYSIHHQPDDRKRAVYGEIFGLLNPGGVFVNIEHVSSPTEWLAFAEPRDVHRLAPPPSPQPEPRRGGPALLRPPGQETPTSWRPSKSSAHGSVTSVSPTWTAI